MGRGTAEQGEEETRKGSLKVEDLEGNIFDFISFLICDLGLPLICLLREGLGEYPGQKLFCLI